MTMERGERSLIAVLSGVPYETVRRYFWGGNVGINTVNRILETQGKIEAERKSAVKTAGRRKTAKKQTPVRAGKGAAK